MRSAPLRFLAPVLLAGLLWGCAALPPSETELGVEEKAWQGRRQALLSHDPWALTGRLGLQTPAEAWHGTVRWEQSGAVYRIAIFGPLGQGAVRIEGRPGRVILDLADGTRHEAADPDRLLAEILGWQLPVAGLRYWLLGVDDPRHSSSAAVLDQEGRLQALSQQGWELRFERYESQGDLSLPTRLQASRPELTVRAVITRWDGSEP